MSQSRKRILLISSILLIPFTLVAFQITTRLLGPQLGYNVTVLIRNIASGSARVVLPTEAITKPTFRAGHVFPPESPPSTRISGESRVPGVVHFRLRPA